MRYAIRDTRYAIYFFAPAFSALPGFASFAGRHFFALRGLGIGSRFKKAMMRFALILIRPRILYGSRQIRYDEIN